MNESHFAVVVGITHYPGYGPLCGPVNDANAFREWLVHPLQGNVPATNIVPVTTPDDADGTSVDVAEPARQAIERALWNVTLKARVRVAQLDPALRPGARASSRLYLYVAGHGIMPGSGQAALLTARAQQGWQENIELRGYEEWYQLDGTFGEVCIFADCCRSYEPLATPGGPSFDRPSTVRGTVHTVVGYAAEPGKLAYEETSGSTSPDQRRGYFSRALVDGLNGAAARDADGYVTSVSLSNYLGVAVPELTEHLPEDTKQSVRMLVDGNHAIRFGSQHVVAPSRKPHQVKVAFPDSFTGPVELVHPDGSRTGWVASNGDWQLDLEDGIYLMTHPGGFSSEGFANEGTFTVTGARDVQL